VKELGERQITACFIIASGLIIFFNLWGRSLENHDYLRYAEIAREMIRTGEWVVPHYNGEVYIDKPPLLFWMIAIPSWLYGSVTPLIARLPSALSAWIGVAVVYFWGKRIYGTVQSGLVSGGVLLTSYQYFFQGRAAKTDMLLCLMVLLSLYFFYLGYKKEGRDLLLFHGLSFLFMGLAVLTKGPFGMIPLLVIVAFLVKERRLAILWSRSFLLGYAILGGIVLSWVLPFVNRVGWEEAVALVKGNRILSRRAPIYFYFVEIWGEFFPWSLLIPTLFLSLWKRRRGGLQTEKYFPLLWFGLLFILLTLFNYRASRYMLPALPPFALMMGGMWRKKVSTFLIPACLFVFIWHGVDLIWLRRDLSNSPGRVLAEQLKPLLDGSELSGYRLDVSTVEEVNFYLDRVIPVLKKTDPLTGRRFVLMPEKVYHDLRGRGNDSILLNREFQYKKGRLVLVSS